MKTFKIAHLYYDLMNLYGENGNVRFLVKKLEEQDLDVEVHFLTIGDKIDFKKYDFYYMGMGSEQNQNLVYEDIIKYKKEIINAINNKKFFLITGNSLELFGKNIKYLDGTSKEAIGAYGFECLEEEFRIVGEQYYKTDLISHNVIGFLNRQTVMSDNGDNLFKVLKGCGYNPKINFEGIHDNNFYGTYLLGPILVRNPYLCDYFIKEICNYLNTDYKNPKKDNLAYKAYHEYLKNFIENQDLKNQSHF